MTSCGGTSNTRTRRSTRTICCTTGMMRMRPGPFTAWKRPKKNTTARSYSRSTLIAEAASTMRTTTRPSAKYISVSFGDDVEDEAFHGGDAQALPAVHGSGRAHAPLLTKHARPAFGGEVLHRLGGSADQLLAPGDHRALAAFRQGAQHEYQEAG